MMAWKEGAVFTYVGNGGCNARPILLALQQLVQLG